MPNKPTLTQKQKKAAALATLFLFILLSLAVFWFVGRPMVHTKRQRAKCRPLTEWEKGQLAIRSCFGTPPLSAPLPMPAYGNIERVW